MVCLTRIAYDAGFIDESLAWNYICSAGQQCIQAFNDWTELGKSFLLGQAMEATEKGSRNYTSVFTVRPQRTQTVHGKENTEIDKKLIYHDRPHNPSR